MRSKRSLPCLVVLLALPWLPATAATPVAQVRVAFDREAITASRATGVADTASGRAVSADDPVRMASISKLAVAIAVMRMVEAGQLDLDADVSPLLGWTLRHPAHPDVPISLRLLLSHTSGITDAAGYWQVPLDGEVRDLLADPRAWDAAHAPGGWFRYANLNFPLVAAVMERASGERFDLLMRRLLFEPLNLDACFGWVTCSDAAVSHAVVQYDAQGAPATDDLRGARPACPVRPARDGGCDLSLWRPGANGALFSPQGGMRISANGLARIGQLLLRGGELDGVRLLRPASVEALFAPQWTLVDGNGVTAEEDDSGQSRAGFFCRYGLATQSLATPVPGCHNDLFGDGVARVGHSGSAYGLLSGLWLDRAAGTGVVYFATGMEDAAPGRHSAFTAIEEAMARGQDDAPR
ncbi:serine hydrolase domain-containing protein [Pseudoxanthomonas koreensis]|uniref:serine hydrolase domain-containing protein n=1 Tax=Pseudoxanthomonas koreensis TaxID=266061 RepID=UPI001391E750|nr:serine hydrolase domain-containing protein [Pseudoxanthomonas koreensis]KAF1694949.1 serine hydrolase [Pseudoxanthomonas koreensis]